MASRRSSVGVVLVLLGLVGSWSLLEGKAPGPVPGDGSGPVCARLHDPQLPDIRGLDVSIEAGGVRVHDAGAPQITSLALELTAMGRAGRLTAVGPGRLSARCERMEIRRPGVVEWYRSSKDGLEQGFTFSEPPPGEGDLLLQVAVGGATALPHRDGLLFTDAQGRRLSYDKLVTVDASGRVLPSRFEVISPSRFRIAVDDVDADYPVVIDPLLTEHWDAEIHNMGHRIAGRADFDGDGFGDLVVAGGDRVHVFLGASTGIGDPNTPATQLSGEDGTDFGRSVAGADLNGDGYDDLVVAMDGAFAVFSGSAAGIPSGNASSADAQLGLPSGEVHAAGDVNGDGFEDLITGMRLYAGGPEGLSTGASPMVEFEPGSAGRLQPAGDVNGDGYADVLVADAAFSDAESNEGALFVYHGGQGGIVDGSRESAETRVESNTPSARFGSYTASIGDVDGDGYDELIVSSWNLEKSLVLRGGPDGIPSGGLEAAFRVIDESGWWRPAGDVNADGYADVIFRDEKLYLGSKAGIARNLDRVAVQFDPWQGGYAQAFSVGDIDADGFDDVALSTTYHTRSDQDVHLYRGGPHLGARAVTSPDIDAFGWSVAGAGDVNGDGYPDMIVGAPDLDGGQQWEGAAFVFHGGPGGPVSTRAESASARIEGNAYEAHFGTTVAGAGDVNNDGFDDILVTATHDTDEYDYDPVAYLFLGGAQGVAGGDADGAAATFPMAHHDIGPEGTAAGSAGDLDGDGMGDVFISGYFDWSPAGEPQRTRWLVLLFHGSAQGIPSGGPSTADTVLWAEDLEPGANPAAGVGDVNGDGFDDLAIGLHDFSGGEVFVLHGSEEGISSRPIEQSDTRVSSGYQPYSFGWSVAAAGDVDGDGFDDLAVGAPEPWSPSELISRVFVFAGGTEGVSTAAATEIVSDTAARLGYTVAGAGDVDLDGYDDLVAGALGSTGDGVPGSVFLFRGGPGGIASGTTAGHERMLELEPATGLGRSVAGVGNSDGNGGDDILVGAPLVFRGLSDRGIAFWLPEPAFFEGLLPGAVLLAWCSQKRRFIA